jgi:hypothetical protein
MTRIDGVVAYPEFVEKFAGETERQGSHGILRRFGHAHTESALVHRFSDLGSADAACATLNAEQSAIAEGSRVRELSDVTRRLAELDEEQTFARDLFAVAQQKREAQMLAEQAAERERVGARQATNTDRYEVIKIK